jgi:hypothetical protein
MAPSSIDQFAADRLDRYTKQCQTAGIAYSEILAQLEDDLKLRDSSLQAYDEANARAVAVEAEFRAADPETQVLLHDHANLLCLRATQLFNTLCRAENRCASRTAKMAEVEAVYYRAKARVQALLEGEPLLYGDDDED